MLEVALWTFGILGGCQLVLRLCRSRVCARTLSLSLTCALPLAAQGCLDDRASMVDFNARPVTSSRGVKHGINV